MSSLGKGVAIIKTMQFAAIVRSIKYSNNLKSVKVTNMAKNCLLKLSGDPKQLHELHGKQLPERNVMNTYKSACSREAELSFVTLLGQLNPFLSLKKASFKDTVIHLFLGHSPPFKSMFSEDEKNSGILNLCV